MKKVILTSLILLTFSTIVFAQDEEFGKNEWSVWGGFSPDSNTAIKGTGRTPDARFGIVAVRYARRFNFSDSFNVKYTADLVPLTVVNSPDIDLGAPPCPTCLPIIVNTRPTRYGFGGSPLGGQVNFRPKKKYQPFIGASGGMLYMSERTPTLGGTKFQWTADIGGGVEIRLKEKKAFTLGYKYYHVSNGGRGSNNPGFDHNLFYIGYTFFSN